MIFYLYNIAKGANMHIKRDIDDFLAKRMFGGKTIVIYGPRQAGKTTAVESYIAANGLSGDVISFNGDETADREVLADASAEKLNLLVGSKRILFIDEAHKVPEIGPVLKRAYDKLKHVQVIASSSPASVTPVVRCASSQMMILKLISLFFWKAATTSID